MKSTLEGLLRIQQLDRRLIVLRRRLDSLPAELGERESHFAALEAEVGRANGERKAALARANTLENDVRDRETRIAKLDKQALEARDPSTVQVVQHEARRLRDEVSKLQEEEMQMLEGAEAADQRRKESTVKVDEAAGELELFRGNIRSDEAEVGGEVAQLSADRDATLDGVESGARSAYEQLSGKHPGKAVAAMKSDSCGGCGTRLVAQDAVRVKAMSGLVRCPTCQRILVTQDLWSAAEESAAGA